jgi:hypothetical protein
MRKTFPRDGRRARRSPSPPGGYGREHQYPVTFVGVAQSDRFVRLVRRLGGRVVRQSRPIWHLWTRPEVPGRKRVGKQAPRLRWHRFIVYYTVRAPAKVHARLRREVAHAR